MLRCNHRDLYCRPGLALLMSFAAAGRSCGRDQASARLTFRLPPDRIIAVPVRVASKLTPVRLSRPPQNEPAGRCVP